MEAGTPMEGMSWGIAPTPRYELITAYKTDLRPLSHDLHPQMQETGHRRHLRPCAGFGDSSGIAIECEADARATELSRGAALALFRILQEALGNAAKHARAGHVFVRLSRSHDEVSLVIVDDGVGFDRGRLNAAGGLGLIMMRERATQLNGKFTLESAEGQKTTVTVTIPFR